MRLFLFMACGFFLPYTLMVMWMSFVTLEPYYSVFDMGVVGRGFLFLFAFAFTGYGFLFAGGLKIVFGVGDED